MKLESLKLEKFQDNTLKKEQMFMLNGGGIYSGAGEICAAHGDSQRLMHFSYGYDSNRNGITTFHNRSNIQDVCDNGFITSDISDSPRRPIL